jgi:tRNA A-37 threonylcarbamoyl transferase component Bud32
MHGLIFSFVQRYVQKEFGSEVWRELLDESGLGQRAYSPARAYPDEEANALIEAASRRLAVPVLQVHETLGKGITPDLIGLYKTHIPPQWRTLDLIENTETMIHSAVRVGNPSAAPPVLTCIRSSDDEVRVIYSSHRRLCGLLRGIVVGVSEYYREIVDIEEEACMLHGDPFCVVRVRRVGMMPAESEAPATEEEATAFLVAQSVSISNEETQFTDPNAPIPQRLSRGSIASDAKALMSMLPVSPGKNQFAIVHHFRLMKLIGAGSMGLIYHAEDTRLGRVVALKFLRPSLLGNAVIRQRFLREAKAMVVARSTHFVTVYDVGMINEVPFMVMECLSGETLQGRLDRQSMIPIPELLKIGKGIASGLIVLHDKHYIHRDLKPGNVWLEPAGGDVKLLDLGVVREQSSSVHDTQTGMILGTPAYMSPEQAAGKEIDHRSDLFSLGCILYTMATGETPFASGDFLSTLAAIATKIPSRPRDMMPDVELLSDFIMKLLEKDPDRRPATAREALAELEAIEQRLT